MNDLWKWFSKNMSNFSDGLKKQLVKDEKYYDSQLAALFAQIALILLWFSLWRTNFFPKLLLANTVSLVQGWFVFFYSAAFISLSPLLTKNRISLHQRYGFKGNIVANTVLTVLAILLEKFYEKSLGGLFCAFSFALLILMLLVIIRPWTDFGLFGFTMGVAVAVAYNLYGLDIPTWVILTVFLMYAFKCWLDQNWLGEESYNQGENSYFKESEYRIILVFFAQMLILTIFFADMVFNSKEVPFHVPNSFMFLFYLLIQFSLFGLGTMGIGIVALVSGIILVVMSCKIAVEKLIQWSKKLNILRK